MLLGVYGASGFGREVMPIACACFDNSEDSVVFIDDGCTRHMLNGRQVLTFEQFLDRPEGDKHVTVAIAEAHVRKRLFERAIENGVAIADVVSPCSIRGDEIEIGKGSIICGYVQITSNVRIGVGFHANIYSYVAHDCVIGDFVTFAPSVHCNGNVHIGDGAYIGTGAILRQGTADKPLLIGAGAVVGMGAVVTKDVPPGVTVIGNPARIMER